MKAKTMKLLRYTESKITINENGESSSHLESTEVVLVHYDNVFDKDPVHSCSK